MKLKIRKPAVQEAPKEKSIEDMSLEEIMALADNAEGSTKKKVKSDPYTPRNAVKPKVLPAWMKEIKDTFTNYRVTLCTDVARVDMLPDYEGPWPWRICIIGTLWNQVDATLLFNQKPRRMPAVVSFCHITDTKVISITKELLRFAEEYDDSAPPVQPSSNIKKLIRLRK